MKEKIQATEIQNYDNLISTPEIFISDIDNVQVIFMLNFVAAPDFINFFDFNHAHTSFELQYIFQNSMESLIGNERKVKLSEGDLLLLPPHMLHKTCTNPKQFLSHCINFSIVSLSEDMETQEKQNSFYETLFSQVNCEILFQNEDIAHCMRKIFALDGNQLSSAKIRLYLRLIFEELTSLLNTMYPQAIQTKPVPSTQYHIDSLRKWFIDAYVSNYYMCKNHIENMSYMLNLSPRQTSRVIKLLTNSTLQELILNQRMNIAFENIKYTKLPLSQIAEMVGYSTYSGFYIAFCKYYNFSPEKLREASTPNT